MERVADEGEGKERDGAEGEDCGDSGGGVLFVGVDCALGSDDGGDSTDAGAHGEQGGEFGVEVEGSAEPGHESDGEGKCDEDEDERDAAELEDVAEDETGSEENEAALQPELLGG